MRSLNNQYLAEIYYGLAHKKSIKDIHKEIRKVTQLFSRDIVDYRCEKYAMALAKKGVKQRAVALDVDLIPFSLNFLKKEEAYENTMTLSYQYAQQEEGKSKLDVINNARDEEEAKARESHTLSQFLGIKVFYLASQHDDSAEDHKDYQGKLYYDRFWRRYIKDNDVKRIIENIIKNRKLRSLQWVINKPVWFITRPNCRHYFEKVSVENVIGKSAQQLIDEKGMHTKEGRRGDSQTINHPLNRSWYNEKNIRNIIEKYKRRLAFHEALYHKQPSDILLGYIDKDKRLIKKWTAYLKKIV